MLGVELLYSKEHEWIRVEGDVGIVGITEYAQDQLGEIVFVELPELGKDMKRGEVIGVVESTKAVSDIYSPVSGSILEVNTALDTNPELVNTNPEGDGWIFKIQMDELDELDTLMDEAEYREYTALL